MGFILAVLLLLMMSKADSEEEEFVIGITKIDDFEQKIDSMTTTVNVLVNITSKKVDFNSHIEFRSRNIESISLNGNGQSLKCSTSGGLAFYGIKNITLRNFTMEGCGSTDDTGTGRAALFICNGSNVLIENIVIRKSKPVALVIMNCSHGTVNVSHSDIIDNNIKADANHPKIRHAVGIHLKLAELSQRGKYEFQGCNLTGNGVSGHVKSGLGGGMSVFFFNGSYSNSVNISDCIFADNIADWGGGLYAKFHAEPQHNIRNNTLIIQSCRFYRNQAIHGGGGATVGYSTSSFGPDYFNHVKITNTIFKSNNATFGGGLSIFSKHSNIFPNNMPIIHVNNCTWADNIANFSASVDISSHSNDTLARGFLPIPLFSDCKFDGNGELGTDHWHANSGSFVITNFEVHFKGSISFCSHTNSALHVTSGRIMLCPHTKMTFSNNRAFRGGALALYGFSSVIIDDDVEVQFINNTAIEKGGAIYQQSFDHHDFIFSRSCFIQVLNREKKSSRLSFVNNHAKSGNSHAIFATTLHPCINSIKELNNLEPANKFKQVVIMEFNPNTLENQIETSGVTFSQRCVTITPGKEIELPVSIRDELNHSLSPVYRLSVRENSCIKIDRRYTSHTDTSVRFECSTCKANEAGVLDVYQTGLHEVATALHLKVLPCPPGYYYYSKNYNCAQCRCSAEKKDQSYEGIEGCNRSHYQALLKQGFWAGYLKKDTNKTNLLTAYCPWGFCFRNGNTTSVVQLPSNPDDLNDSLFCDDNRSELLCGTCDRKTSAYFHDPLYRCGSSSSCSLAAFYFIISELLPMVLLFTVIVVFNISLTTGTFHGFIFFCQVTDALSINGRGIVKLPHLVKKLSLVYQLLYGFLNLDFFSIEPFHFCLWNRAKVLDVLSMKFVTVLLAFLLINFLVVALKYCSCSRLDRIRGTQSTQKSFINGISAFLLLSYSQCIKISFMILSPIYLKGRGGRIEKTLSFYEGKDYFGRDRHWYHGTISLVMLASVVGIPLVLFLINFIYRCLLLLLRRNYIPVFGVLITKVKPLLDSLEDCFKERMHFFAGLYLFYRIAILSLYVFCNDLGKIYILMELLMMAILCIHTTFLPYKQQSHNIVDSLLFANLAVINGITMYVWLLRTDSGVIIVFTQVLLWFQLFLIYLPLIILCLYIIKRVVQLKTHYRDWHTEEIPLAELDASYVDPPDLCINHDDIPYQDFQITN